MIEVSPFVWVIIGGLLEPLWVIGLKFYESSHKYRWLAMALVFMIVSPMFVGLAADAGMSIGVAYSIWTGMGAALAMLAGFLLFEENVSRLKVFFVVIIVIGIVGLRLTSGVA